jgi:hypothetical protein
MTSAEMFKDIQDSIQPQPAAAPQPTTATQPQPQAQPATAAQPQPQPEMIPEGSVENPTWRNFVNARIAKLRRGATPEELAAIEAEASQQLDKFADANKVNTADAATMNASQKAAEGAIAKANSMRGRTVPSAPLLTPRSSAPPSVAGPMFPSNAAAAGMGAAMNDAATGITSRGGGVVSTERGGYIQQGAGGTKSVSSPYGATGSGAGAAGYSIDTGKMGPGDANLRAQTAAIKSRQASGVFSPTAPTIPTSAPRAVTAQAPSPQVSPSPTPPVAQAPRMPSLNPTMAGTTAAGVMSNTPPSNAPAPAVAAAPSVPQAIPAVGAAPAPAMSRARTVTGQTPSAPVPTSAPPAVATAQPSGGAPPGGWLNLAKNNFNASMAGEIVDMTKNKVASVANTVGSTVKSGYAAAGAAMMPVIQPALNQAKANFAASTLGKAVMGQKPAPITSAPPPVPLVGGSAPIAARAKGGPVTAGKPYLVGEKGPEVIVPKMDSLESVGKKGKFKNGVNSNPRSGSADSDFNQWFQGLQKKELERDIANRPAGHQQMEKDMGLTPSSERMVGYPKTILEDAKAGFDEGVTQIGKTAAGLGSYIPGNVGKEFEKRRQLYDERGQIIADYRARSPVNNASLITPGGLAKTAVTTIPEVFNPVNKPGMAAKVANAAWHGARGYLPDKSLKDAAISSISSVVGEKTEDLVTRGKGLVGNTVGALTETGAQYLLAPPSGAQAASKTVRTMPQPYLVGERGPEVIVPQTSGTVIPNHKLAKASSPPMAPPVPRNLVMR